MGGTRNDQRQILIATAVAAVLSGAPSTSWALARGGRSGAIRGALESTRAVGTLLPGGRPGLLRGAAGHGLVSLAVGEAIAPLLGRRGSIARGALLGGAVGVVTLGVVAPRRYPAIAALALGPQLADNAAFGAVLAMMLDR